MSRTPTKYRPLADMRREYKQKTGYNDMDCLLRINHYLARPFTSKKTLYTIEQGGNGRVVSDEFCMALSQAYGIPLADVVHAAEKTNKVE